jgi:uncharacterized protein YidB (DUF937 family)
LRPAVAGAVTGRSSGKEEVTMSRGFPSMTALLGLLAIAGYQNRDKLAEMLGGSGQNAPRLPGQGGPGQGSLGQGGLGQGGLGQGGLGQGGSLPGGLGGLLGGLGGGGVGDLLGGGLRDLVDSFKQNGQGDKAESWVGRGPNQEIQPREIEQAISPDVLATLSQQTGLSRQELLERLSRELPRAVDQYTPEGRLPASTDFAR